MFGGSSRHRSLFTLWASYKKGSGTGFANMERLSVDSVAYFVVGMLLLAAWSTNGWLPGGHAIRMALDLGLHRALDRLVENTGKPRTEEEERDLGKSLFQVSPYLYSSFICQLFLLVYGYVSIGLTTSEFNICGNASPGFKTSTG